MLTIIMVLAGCIILESALRLKPRRLLFDIICTLALIPIIMNIIH